MYIFSPVHGVADMEPSLPAACMPQKCWTGIVLCALTLVLIAQTNPQSLDSSCAHHYDRERNCCNECQAVKQFTVLRKGDAVTATQCICRAGYHCSQDCEYCRRDSPCFPGFEVKEKANRKSDTKCTPCRPMYFSNETSLTMKCKQMTNCTALGLRERVPGKVTSDAVCINDDWLPSHSSGGSMLPIAVGLACGCGIIIVFICAVISHRRTLTPLTDCVQQRFAYAWCSIRGGKRSEAYLPADAAIDKPLSDHRNRDPESEMFLPHKKLVEATHRASGSTFCALAERPDCSYVPILSRGAESPRWAARSPRIPRENPGGGEGEGPSTARSEDRSPGTSIEPLSSSGYETQGSICSTSSAQGSRDSVDTAPYADSEGHTPCNAPASARSAPLSSRQPGTDCHTAQQSNSTSSTHKPENIPGHSSTNPGSRQPSPADENSHKSGNSTPSGFPCGSNTTYKASGQSVLSVGGSVVFNVVINVNRTTEEGRRADMSDRPDIPTKGGDHPRGDGRFPPGEEKPGGSGADTGLPVQEDEGSLGLPVQEEREVNFPVQETANSRGRWDGNLSLARNTVEQENRKHPKESPFFPVQEDGKSEHLAKEEEHR
uniref:tumor necrosis factor receptor superfamily member 11A-like isoform X2 n=1 Tax=Pristiophorus japonicus TaxID=55135 RepID=UPI00398F404E